MAAPAKQPKHTTNDARSKEGRRPAAASTPQTKKQSWLATRVVEEKLQQETH